MKKRDHALAPVHVVKNGWLALKYFLSENGIDKSSILAYYSIFSSFFLLIFFSFLFNKFIGDPGNAVKNMYPFSPEFFSKIAPIFFQKAGELAAQVEDLGLIGLAVFLFVGIQVFNKMIHYINDMFFIKIRHGILLRRIKEIGLLMIAGILIVFSFLFTGLISTINTLAAENPFFKKYIDPAFVLSIDNLLVRIVLPFLVTFLFFFILFKWIPEKKIKAGAALIAAVFSALLWELIKRAYTYYLIHVSVLRKIESPIVAIILFGFWMEMTMGIMLYGAKFTFLLDKEENAKPKKDH
ncbi:MAG: YihY/virulence factor BrkB family protein [Candidatus Aminicenantes bacterium]|nr:YihY/virulence factor BrkB family protein [Candidatus Aminicenantes bacterium]